MKDNGYYQAVDRLAWEILQLSETTQRPILEANPHLLNDFEVAMDVCRNMMTPEEGQTWDKLDEIFSTIVTTYSVHPEEVYTEVFAKIYEYDVQLHGNPLQ